MAVTSNVVFSQKQPDPWDYDVGSLTGRTLNIVSPSFGGPAFVPRNINSTQSLTQHLGPERYNHIRHWNDELSHFTHSQGYHGLKNWLLNGGQNATHLRVLGVGSNNTDNETGLTPGAGFKLSDYDYEMSFLFFKDNSLNTSLELGVDAGAIDATRFLHTSLFTKNLEFNTTNDVFNQIKLDSIFENINTIPNLNNESAYNKIHIREISQSDSGICVYGSYRSSRFNNNTQGIEFLKSNIDSFEYKFQTALTPWVTSQPYDRSNITVQDTSKIHESVINLFRFHALDDGDAGNRFRVKVNPTNKGNINQNLYAKFDVYFYEYDPRDNSFRILEKFENLDLNPESKDYIGRQIGTRHVYCDTNTKKIVDVGKYNNVSKYLRVEINDDIEFHKLGRQKELIPSGFRSYPHIDFSNLLNDATQNLDYLFLPPKYRMSHLTFPAIDNKFSNEWGVEFYRVASSSNRDRILPSLKILSDINTKDVSILGNKIKQTLNGKLLISPHYFYTRFLPKNILTHEDNYLNSFFHLEKIKDTDNFSESTYHPSGVITSDKFINLDDIDITNNKYANKLSFDFFTYGGFDGTDLLDHDKRYLTQRGLSKEFYDEDLKEESPIYNSYKLGVDIITDYENNNGDILAIPDTSHEKLNSYCVKKCEDLGRYIFVGDAKGLYVDALQRTDYETSVNTIFKSFDYYNVKKEFVNYTLNRSALQEEFYSLEDVKTNVYDNILRFELNPQYNSRYNFQTLGCLKANLESETFYISPVNYVLSIIANNSVRTTKVLKTIDYQILNTNTQLTVSNLFPSREDENKIEDKFDKIRINPLRTSSEGKLRLNSDMTTYDNTESLFCQVKEVESIQEIKKRIMLSLYTDTSVIQNTFFFNSGSSTNSLYQDISFQLNSVLEELKTEGIIENYSVQINRNYFFDKRDDINNLKFSGSIVVQLVGDNDERTQQISLNDILNQVGQYLPASDTTSNTRNVIF